MTADEVRDKLRAACQEAGGQTAWARQVELGSAYVSDVLSGRREPGPAILKALSLARAVDYQPIDDGVA